MEKLAVLDNLGTDEIKDIIKKIYNIFNYPLLVS